MHKVKELINKLNTSIFNEAINGGVVEMLGLSEVFEQYTTAPELMNNGERFELLTHYGERVLHPSFYNYRDGVDWWVNIRDYITQSWLMVNAYTLKTLYETTIQEYNPIENYDRYEETTTEGETSDTSTTTYGEQRHIKGAGKATNTTETTTGARSDVWSETAATDTATTEPITSTETTIAHTIEHSEFVSPFTTSAEKHNKTTYDKHDPTTTTNTTSKNETTSNIGARGGGNTIGAQSNKGTTTTTEEARTDTDSQHIDTQEGGATQSNTTVSHIHGNIGVTTAAQMLESQRLLAEFTFWGEVYRRLINDITVGVL